LLSSMSTESLLNSFPMFGHPGISALEYAGSLEAIRNKRSTSVTLESLKREYTPSTQDENTTPPTTAGAESPIDADLLPQTPLIEEFGCQQRRRGTFVNHTPRDFEMRSSKTVEVYRPSRASNENYSRPRTSYQANPIVTSLEAKRGNGNTSSIDSHTIEKRLTINPDAPIELEATELSSPPLSPEFYKPLSTMHRRSVSVPINNIDAYRPFTTPIVGIHSSDVSIENITNSVPKPQEKKRQRRQTPFKIMDSKSTIGARHSPLEPWVAEHRRKGTNETVSDFSSQLETGIVEEVGTFGVIQRYFDSQTGGPVSSSKALRQTCSASPPNIPLPTSPESCLQEPFKEPIVIFPLDELNLLDEPPPAVPDRSPKRLTNPSFPLHIKSTLSMDSEFAFAADGQYSPYAEAKVLFMPKKRDQKRVEVGRAARAGSSNLGRMAPPILGHGALKASSDMGLNDLSYYLKHTGPAVDPQPSARQRTRNGIKIFRVKQRKTLAARVGSVEGSPQRARKQALVPACAREMTTSGGARHLKIVIPTETLSGPQTTSLSVSQSRMQRRSRHVSIVTFTDEMLNPLAGPDMERLLSGYETPRRSFSESLSLSPRSPKRPPKSPKPVPVNDHPLASREEQTRARKLRDLQRIKRKPLPTYTQANQYSDTVIDTLPTPAQTPEPISDLLSNDLHEDEGIDEDDYIEENSPANVMTQLQSRVVLLQRQNTELTEALAKVVGLELEEGELKSEDVLNAFRQ
ncbi:hypothetical protein BKA66DRAFT_369503, partial [Pyrenochaeta sp. MPI-SDFR-AT-0127]